MERWVAKQRESTKVWLKHIFAKKRHNMDNRQTSNQVLVPLINGLFFKKIIPQGGNYQAINHVLVLLIIKILIFCQMP